MKALLTIVWNEPAVAISLVVAVGLLVAEALIGDGLTVEDLAPAFTISGAGLAIRQYVTPMRENG